MIGFLLRWLGRFAPSPRAAGGDPHESVKLFDEIWRLYRQSEQEVRELTLKLAHMHKEFGYQFEQRQIEAKRIEMLISYIKTFPERVEVGKDASGRPVLADSQAKKIIERMELIWQTPIDTEIVDDHDQAR